MKDKSAMEVAQNIIVDVGVSYVNKLMHHVPLFNYETL